MEERHRTERRNNLRIKEMLKMNINLASKPKMHRAPFLRLFPLPKPVGRNKIDFHLLKMIVELAQAGCLTGPKARPYTSLR
jgi:hypothetical protein